VDELGIPFAKTCIIYNSVDTERFSPAIPQLNLRQQLGLDDGCVLLGWVGRMHAAKDLANLLNAYEIVTKTAISSHALVLVGDGHDRAMAERLVRDKGLSERVFFLGECQDIPDLMRNFSLYISSSKTEGVPLVILEAMSTGLPCVATDVGGVAEVVKQGTGLLVPAKDPQALAQAALQFIDDSAYRQQASAQARHYVASTYRFEDMIDAYQEALNIV
jgi:glycosyltransferase involved in cell wall biosynthesis